MKKEKIILVLNGKNHKKNDLIPFLKKYDKIICADGAANHIIKMNITPDYILGDLDSFKSTINNNDAIKIIDIKKSEMIECSLNKKTCGTIIIKGFGSSDCNLCCGSHLKISRRLCIS